jgi:hypothetical protein
MDVILQLTKKKQKKTFFFQCNERIYAVATTSFLPLPHQRAITKKKNKEKKKEKKEKK